MSSTTTRGGAAGAELAAALEAAGDAGDEAGAVEAAAVETAALEAGAALVGVPTVDALDDGAAGADVGALVCLALELQAVATVANATTAATRK